ncbi:MAG: hypothetical protein K0R39_4462 [Symbiobacteriaceae bacterium]|jgi:hypothetical protein|nr:hypothetical protein [Symbiobacteriaceae bacterium]
MTRCFSVFLAVALLTITGCATGDPKNGLTTTSTDQGIELTASIASATFAPGAVPQVDVTVRNNGKTAVRYIRADGCDKGIGVWMEQGGDKTAFFDEKLAIGDQPRACTEAISTADLAPGGTIRATYAVMLRPDQPPPANGEHFINVSFNRGETHGQEKPVVAALKVTVAGGEARVTEAEALAAAKADARVVQWLKAHPDGPVTVVRWHQDRWLVRFLSKPGPTPHEVEVAVKGAPARVESVTWR